METLRARSWLYAKLAADTTLAGLVSTRLYRAGEVPTTVSFPYVTYQVVTSTDHRALGGTIFGAKVLVQVTVYGLNTASATLEAIVDRVQTLLHKQSGAVAGGEVYACQRAAIVPLPPETSAGLTYVPLAMEFELEAQAA